MDDGGERGALVLLDETPVADVLEPPVGDVGRDFLHGVEAEVAAVGEDRGQQHADFGVDPLAGLLEVDAEPEVVLDLDEQVGQPDRAAAGVQPAVQLGEAFRLRRVGLFGRVRLEPPPVVVERDLPVVGDTFQELAVHVDGLVERVAPRLVQEAHQREVAARGRHLAHPVGRRGPDAVEQDPLIVAVDPVHVDVQHPGRLDRFQPRQKPFHATDRRVRRAGLDVVQGGVRIVVADGDQRVEAVAHRRRQTLRHALRQQSAGLVPGRPHRTAQHRVGRRENVFVAEPAPRPRQQRRRAIEPQRFVFEEPRQPFSGGGVERAQTQVLTDALLMLGDRLLPAGVGVDRLGVGPQLQSREPQDLPVDLQGRLLGESAEHTHEGDLVREAQPIVAAPSQGDLSSVGLEEGGIADQAGAGDGVGGRHGSVRNKRTF